MSPDNRNMTLKEMCPDDVESVMMMHHIGEIKQESVARAYKGCVDRDV